MIIGKRAGMGRPAWKVPMSLVRIALCLSHHLAWVRLEIPTEFGLEFQR